VLRADEKLWQSFRAPEAAAEKRFPAVILSVAKDLALRIFVEIRDSSSPAAPQNDSPEGFVRSL